VTVPDVYRALWRHKVMIVVLTIGLAAAAWYLTSRQPRIYQATTLVRIQQQVNGPNDVFLALQTGQRLAETYARITATTTVARGIEKQLKGQVAYGEIHLHARQIAELELIAISAKSRSATRAQLIANAAPAALREFIAKTGTTGEQVITIQGAARPRSPVAPNKKLNVALAAILGLIFNGALALLLYRLADRVGGPEEIEQLAGKPVLAVIPHLSLTSPRQEDRDSAAKTEASAGGGR
jgi:capsular polysaccharide biosynthesis protein